MIIISIVWYEYEHWCYPFHIKLLTDMVSLRYVFALYMSMRIRSEQMTQEEFSKEIGFDEPFAHSELEVHADIPVEKVPLV